MPYIKLFIIDTITLLVNNYYLNKTFTLYIYYWFQLLLLKFYSVLEIVLAPCRYSLPLLNSTISNKIQYVSQREI